MARVSVEQKSLTDPRFELLGRLLRSNRHDALGRMILVWNECQERSSYTLPAQLVGAIMGNRKGPSWVVEADLAEWSDDQNLRIKGTEGRVEWLAAKRERARANGQKGGRPKNQPGTNTGSSSVASGLQPETPPTPTPTPARQQKTEETVAAQRCDAVASPDGATQPMDSRKKKRAEPTGPHHEAIRDFCGRWQAKYGEKYPFTPKDASAVAWMLKQAGGDAAKLAAIFDRYFADADPFYAADRHTLGMLRAKFARWLPDRPVETSRDARQRAAADERTQYRHVEGRDG